jgi:hypothetical protein
MAQDEKNVTDVMAADLLSQISTMNAKLLEEIAVLENGQSKRLPMGTAKAGFAKLASMLAQEFPESLPSGVDMTLTPGYLNKADGLCVVMTAFHQLEKNAKRYKLLVDSRAYSDALSYYSHVEMLSKRNVPGMDSIYQRLKAHFKRKKNKGEQSREEQIVS